MIIDAKTIFLTSVYNTIKDNPEWLGSTINAVHHGMTSRLEEEIDLRAKAEAAAIMAYDNDVLTDAQDAAIRKVITNSNLVSGTEYAKKLEKGL